MGVKLWSGMLNKGLASVAEEFNSSIAFDYRLLEYDLKASKVHAKMLQRQKIIDPSDGEKIAEGLAEMLKDFENEALEIDWTAEDVHTFIEGELTQRIGEAGKRLHTARSRNDQVATAMKLYAISRCEALMKETQKLIEELTKKADAFADTILPGYTHLQRAQPVTFGHQLMAYAQMFLRDYERLAQCKERTKKECPLGSGALAGTTYPIDREWCASQLGFEKPTANSMDGVSDRDFIIELLQCTSLLMMHLSRFSEEIILWCSWEFQFTKLGEEFSTGSSIMPQKKNPDIAELVRGKTGRVYGSLFSLLTVMKGLPLSYNKDMQEDKEIFFDSVDTVLGCLMVFTPMIESLIPQPKAMRAAAATGFINATDCADYLVGKGMAFRDAYQIVGELVEYCLQKNTVLEDLPLTVYTSYSPLFEEDVFHAIALETCVQRRTSYGGPTTVKEQIKEVEEYIKRVTHHD